MNIPLLIFFMCFISPMLLIMYGLYKSIYLDIVRCIRQEDRKSVLWDFLLTVVLIHILTIIIVYLINQCILNYN